MRTYVVILLILAIIAPSFVSWLPHGVLHAYHDAHMINHHSDDYLSHHDTEEKVDAIHDHHENIKAATHHPIQINSVSFLSDYLHLDLQQAKDININISDLPVEIFDGFIFNSHFSFNIILSSVQNRGPPLNFDLINQSKSFPVYLSTQRIRV